VSGHLIRSLLARAAALRPARGGPEPATGTREDLYPVSPTCQIPNLSFLYELYFDRRTDGTFVEVGAFDGFSFSNTSCLAEVGWTGHYIEPVPSSAASCRARYARHPAVAVHEVAIGPSDGTVELQVGGQLSTSRADVFAEYQDLEWARPSFDRTSSMTVRQTSMDSFLAENQMDAGFDLLVVDVEGYESEVFAGFDLARWRPTMMIVELADAHPDLVSTRGEHAGLLLQILDAGYVTAYKDSINTVFVGSARYTEAHKLLRMERRGRSAPRSASSIDGFG
jgi:FkbM family methyltransferase